MEVWLATVVDVSRKAAGGGGTKSMYAQYARLKYYPLLRSTTIHDLDSLRLDPVRLVR